MDSLKLDLYDNSNAINNYTLVDGVLKNSSTNEEIPMKCGNNLNGSIKIKKDGTEIYAINDGKNCIIKRDGQEDVETIKNLNFCTMDVVTNLVVNGYGEYGNNTNFGSFKYEDGTFVLEGDKAVKLFSNKYIEIGMNEKKYFYSVDAKSNNPSVHIYLVCINMMLISLN